MSFTWVADLLVNGYNLIFALHWACYAFCTCDISVAFHRTPLFQNVFCNRYAKICPGLSMCGVPLRIGLAMESAGGHKDQTKLLVSVSRHCGGLLTG